MARCKNCGYYWQEENEDFATCHFESVAVWDLAPCEYDDLDGVLSDFDMEGFEDD